MVVRVALWRITWRFLIVYLVFLTIGFLSFFGMFFGFDGGFHAKPWSLNQTLFFVIFAVIFLITYIPSVTCFYFIIEDDHFTQKRIGKDYQFEYKNIEFIDIEKSQKKKMVIFYSSTAKMRYMIGDKNGVLLETLIKKCPKVMSVEEFRRRHPEEKY